MCFIPSVGYPLSICHISNDGLHSLQKQYLMTLKNKLCFHRKHSHAFSFVPRSFGGIGMSDLSIEAHIGGIENMICTLCTLGQGQEINMMFLKTIQLASGMSQPIFQYPTVPAPHFEGHFYKHLRQFLVSHNLSFEIVGIETATPPQEYDRCIMDVVTSDDEFLDRDIKYIYYSKSFLQLRWVSDLCNAGSKWKLRTPLCPWKIPYKPSNRLWPFYYSHKKNIL